MLRVLLACALLIVPSAAQSMGPFPPPGPPPPLPDLVLLPLSSFTDPAILSSFSCQPTLSYPLSTSECSGHGQCHVLFSLADASSNSSSSHSLLNSSSSSPMPAFNFPLRFDSPFPVLPTSVCVCDSQWDSPSDYISNPSTTAMACAFSTPTMSTLFSLLLILCSLLTLLSLYKLLQFYIQHKLTSLQSAYTQPMLVTSANRSSSHTITSHPTSPHPTSPTSPTSHSFKSNSSPLTQLAFLYPLICAFIGLIGCIMCLLRLTTLLTLGDSIGYSLLQALLLNLFQLNCSLAIYTTTRLALSVTRRVVGRTSTLSGLLHRLRIQLIAADCLCLVGWLLPLIIRYIYPQHQQPLTAVMLTISPLPYWSIGFLHLRTTKKIEAALTSGMEHLNPGQRRNRQDALSSLTQFSVGVRVAMMGAIPVQIVFAAWEPLRQYTQWQMFSGYLMMLLVLFGRLRMIGPAKAPTKVSPTPVALVSPKGGAGGKKIVITMSSMGGGESVVGGRASEVPMMVWTSGEHDKRELEVSHAPGVSLQIAVPEE